MKTFPFRIGIVLLASALLVKPATCRADAPGQEMASAAQSFLAALTAEQKEKATYTVQDDERLDWHFIPKPRKGLPIKEMTSAQRALAHALLATGLSQRGFVKAVTIMSLDQVLKDMEQGKGPTRDPELYFFTVFGQPGAQGAWGWRVEGHHLSLNFTLSDEKVVSMTPSFFGSNPGEVREGPRKGLRVLGAEEELGRELVKSLTEEQRKLAVLRIEAPREIITGNARKVTVGAPEGVPAAKLNAAQSELLTKLVKEYLFRHRADVAEQDLKKIQASGWEKLHFAWAGDFERGQPHYYKVQGPTFLLEYDNTQNNANHVHSVWRDFEGDFGVDVLRLHYDQTPHSK